MSKIGQYIVDLIDHDDMYWQSHEYGDSGDDWPQIKIHAWYNLANLPPDVKEKLAECGIDDYILDDDVPF